MPSTRSKYIRVEQQARESETKLEEEIRLTMKNRDEVYLNRAYLLFLDEKKQFIVIKAAERVIPKALKVAQIIKKRIPGLHQIYKITGNVVAEVYKPIERGLDQVRKERIISVLQIRLTKKPTADEKAHSGYQPPITKTQALSSQAWQKIKQQNLERKRRYEEREERQGGGDRKRQRRDDHRQDRRRDYRREQGRDQRRGERREQRRDQRRDDRRRDDRQRIEDRPRRDRDRN